MKEKHAGGSKPSKYFEGKTIEDMQKIPDDGLIEGFRSDYEIPRDAKTGFARHQKNLGLAGDKENIEWMITDEKVFVEKVPGFICKFCTIQTMIPVHEKAIQKWKLEPRYIRFMYYHLLIQDGVVKYKAGGQATLMTPLSIAKQIGKVLVDVS